MDIQDDEISERELNNHLSRIRDPRLLSMYRIGWVDYPFVMSIIWNVLRNEPGVVNDHVPTDNRLGCIACGMGWFQRMMAHYEVASLLRMYNPYLNRIVSSVPSAGKLLVGATPAEAYFVSMYDRHRMMILRNLHFNMPRVVLDHVPTMPVRKCLVCHFPIRVPRVCGSLQLPPPPQPQPQSPPSSPPPQPQPQPQTQSPPQPQTQPQSPPSPPPPQPQPQPQTQSPPSSPPPQPQTQSPPSPPPPQPQPQSPPSPPPPPEPRTVRHRDRASERSRSCRSCFPWCPTFRSKNRRHKRD